jgi:hypothetical protein
VHKTTTSQQTGSGFPGGGTSGFGGGFVGGGQQAASGGRTFAVRQALGRASFLRPRVSSWYYSWQLSLVPFTEELNNEDPPSHASSMRCEDSFIPFVNTKIKIELFMS